MESEARVALGAWNTVLTGGFYSLLVRRLLSASSSNTVRPQRRHGAETTPKRR
jgi:hypothetical protein